MTKEKLFNNSSFSFDEKERIYLGKFAQNICWFFDLSPDEICAILKSITVYDVDNKPRILKFGTDYNILLKRIKNDDSYNLKIKIIFKISPGSVEANCLTKDEYLITDIFPIHEKHVKTPTTPIKKLF